MPDLKDHDKQPLEIQHRSSHLKKYLGHIRGRIISEHILEGQHLLRHSSRNKGAGRHYLPPPPPSINTRPSAGYSTEPTLTIELAYTKPCLPSYQQICLFQSCLPWSQHCSPLPQKTRTNIANTVSPNPCTLWGLSPGGGRRPPPEED